MNTLTSIGAGIVWVLTVIFSVVMVLAILGSTLWFISWVISLVT